MLIHAIAFGLIASTAGLQAQAAEITTCQLTLQATQDAPENFAETRKESMRENDKVKKLYKCGEEVCLDYEGCSPRLALQKTGACAWGDYAMSKGTLHFDAKTGELKEVPCLPSEFQGVTSNLCFKMHTSLGHLEPMSKVALARAIAIANGMVPANYCDDVKARVPKVVPCEARPGGNNATCWQNAILAKICQGDALSPTLSIPGLTDQNFGNIKGFVNKSELRDYVTETYIALVSKVLRGGAKVDGQFAGSALTIARLSAEVRERLKCTRFPAMASSGQAVDGTDFKKAETSN